MKARILSVLAAAMLFAGSAHAQNLVWSFTNSSSGTRANKLAKITGITNGNLSQTVHAQTLQTTAPKSERFPSAGLVVGGAGTSGTVQVQFRGSGGCVFDGSTTVGDHWNAASTTQGDCHDTGSTTRAAGDYGTILSANSGAETPATVDLEIPEPQVYHLMEKADVGTSNLTVTTGGFNTTIMAASFNPPPIDPAYTGGTIFSIKSSVLKLQAASSSVTGFCYEITCSCNGGANRDAHCVPHSIIPTTGEIDTPMLGACVATTDPWAGGSSCTIDIKAQAWGDNVIVLGDEDRATTGGNDRSSALIDASIYY